MFYSHFVMLMFFLQMLFPAMAVSKEASGQKRPQLEITLRTSRSQVQAGTGFGIIADIKNKSETTVYLTPKYLTMTLPPELTPGRNNGPSYWWALIRGSEEAVPPLAVNDPDAKVYPAYRVIARLSPDSATTAYWTVENEAVGDGGQKLNGDWLSDLRFILFAPGEYLFKVDALYWSDEASAREKRNNNWTETAEIKLQVAAPQIVIILGSLVGGLIAYFLLFFSKKVSGAGGLTTTVLLSLIIPVLLSRVSENQFLIKVSINDFWGAIAIGFVANLYGVSILKKYVPGMQAKEERAALDQTPGS